MKRFLVGFLLCCLWGCGEEAVTPVKVTYTELALLTNGPTRTLEGRVESLEKLSMSFPIAGKVEKVMAQLGDHVGAQQHLAALVLDEFQIKKSEAEAGLAANLERLKAASEKLKLAEQMLNAKVGTKKEYDESLTTYESLQAMVRESESAVQIAQENFNRTSLRSPKGGFIVSQHVVAGDFVGAGQVLFEIHADGALRVRVNVPEEMALKLMVNDPVYIAVADTGQKQLKGNIAVMEQKPEGSNAVPALLQIENQVGLRAGMKVEAIFSVQEKEKPMWWLPINMVLNAKENGRGVVYVYYPAQSVVREQTVDLGKQEGSLIAVMGGLKAGDKLISQANSPLADGMLVTAVTASEIPVFKQKVLDLE